MSLGATSNFPQNIFKSHKRKEVLVYEFGEFRIDAAHLMVYRQSEAVPFTPKQVETLVALVERRGEIVSKEELMDRLWPDSAVEESNLSQNLYILRKTLGNRPDGKPMIETFRRRGYRFNGEIQRPAKVELLVATRGKPQDADETTLATPNKRTAKQKYILPAIVSLAALLLLAFGTTRFLETVQHNDRTPINRAAPAYKMTRLTPDQNIGDTAISPDGKYLAYSLAERGKHGLWLKDLASKSVTRVLPPTEEGYGDVVFARDGSQIFYTTRIKGQPELTMFRVPAFGGESQLVARHVTSPSTPSPDGKQIAFVRMTVSERGVIIANTDGSGERVLSTRAGRTSWYEAWGSTLSWSPDGRKIALCGAQAVGGHGRYELVEVSVADGAEQIIPIPDWNYVDDVVWLGDQSGLVVVARERETSPFQVWRISYPDGEASRLTNDTNEYDDLSLSADSRLLVVKQNYGNVNLWTTPLDDPAKAKQLTFGATASASDGYYGVDFTPDGNIIYSSPRGGNFDLWMMNARGGEEKQLTRNAGDFNGTPRVSPDGNTIVFVSSRSGKRQLWRMDMNGGDPRQLTDGNGADDPWISPDGAWVYFTYWHAEGHIIAKVPIDGGEVIPVYETNDPKLPTVSPDGRQMLFDFYEDGASQPWKKGLLTLESGEMKVVEETGLVYGWTPDSRSIISSRGNPGNIWEVPLGGGKPRKLTNFNNGRIRNFAVSPDFRQIAIARGNPTAEALMITDF